MFKGTSTDIKNGLSKNFVYVIMHVNFRLNKTQPDGVILKKLIIDDKCISKRV